MEYLCAFCFCFFGMFFVRSIFVQSCARENFVYYILLMYVKEKEDLRIVNESGEEVSCEEVYKKLGIEDPIVEKVVFFRKKEK